MTALITTRLHPDGVLVASIDMPGRSMNVFSTALKDALEALMDEVDAAPDVASVVLTSGKASFLAGADLVMVKAYTTSARTSTPGQMIDLCGRLGRLFVRLEASAKPWVAAVNGTALGGGLELAMACRARLVSDAPGIQLGVPEVRWGLLPGAGGTQRLPRLAGFDRAMNMLLTGAPMDADAAVAAGIFNGKRPAAGLLDDAHRLARELQGQAFDPAAKFRKIAQADVPAYSVQTARQVARDFGIDDSRLDHYPAYLAIINSVLMGARLPLRQAGQIEMEQFIGLMFDPVAGNMMRSLFLNRQRADKEARAMATPTLRHAGFGSLGAAHASWDAALTRSGLSHGHDATLEPGAMELIDAEGGRHRIAAATPGTCGSAGNKLPLAVLSGKGAYGQVMEIVGADGAASGAATALALAFKALPWHTPGPSSVLAELEGALRAGPEGGLAAQALIAAKAFAAGRVNDTELLDVAACAAGASPAWSGGPFTWLWNNRAQMAQRLPEDVAVAWPRLLGVLEACHE